MTAQLLSQSILYNPNISLHILHTVPYTFPKVLMRRICFKIQSFSCWWSFPLFSWPWCVIQGWYCEEKLDASHSYVAKGGSREKLIPLGSQQATRTLQHGLKSSFISKNHFYCRKPYWHIQFSETKDNKSVKVNLLESWTKRCLPSFYRCYWDVFCFHKISSSNLFSEKAIAFLFHVVVNDSGNFLLPDFQTIDVNVILNVFKGTPESVHSSSKFP